jgi:hypothetical protein
VGGEEGSSPERLPLSCFEEILDLTIALGYIEHRTSDHHDLGTASGLYDLKSWLLRTVTLQRTAPSSIEFGSRV